MNIIIAFLNLSRIAKMILFMIIFVQSDNSKYTLIEFSIELHTVDNITINYPRSVGCRYINGAILSSPNKPLYAHSSCFDDPTLTRTSQF